MKVKITIDTDNAAFDGSGWGIEIARLLDIAGDYLKDHPYADQHRGEVYTIRDSNGNSVCKVKTGKGE